MKHSFFSKLTFAGLYLLLLFLGSSLSSQSYSYLPTIKEGNRWKTYAGGGMGFVHTIDYHLHGDSIVGGKSYLKIIRENGTFTGGLVREDTLEKKIYNINLNNSPQEYLRLNFNLNLGDTVQGNVVVVGVDTSFVFGRYRRRIAFNSPDYCLCGLIEGVGASSFGVWPDGGLPMGVWFFSEGMISPLNEVEQQSNLFSIFPNPGSDHFNVEIKDDSGSVYHYFLYDSYGKLSQSGDLNAANLNRINVNSLSSGLYFIKITDDQSNPKGVFKVYID